MQSYISVHSKKASLQKFIDSGQDLTIREKVVQYLTSNPNLSFTAKELQSILEIRFRSSICKPLKDLVDAGLIKVVSDKYDSETNREVGLYQIVLNSKPN